MNMIIILIPAAVILVFLLIILGSLLWANYMEKIRITNKKVILRGGKNVNPDAAANGDGIIGEDMSHDQTVVKRRRHKKNMPGREIWLTELQSQTVYRGRFYHHQLLVGRMEDPAEVSGDGMIRIDDTKVSHVHCRIYQENDSYMVEDCCSTNHTWVNGMQITVPVNLKNGDMLRLANKVYQVQFVKAHTE